MSRVLIACVGNVLRGDDGFGVAVSEELARGEPLPAGVDLIETGIGGLSIVQQLMNGYDTLLVVDALARGANPGTLVVAERSGCHAHRRVADAVLEPAPGRAIARAADGSRRWRAAATGDPYRV